MVKPVARPPFCPVNHNAPYPVCTRKEECSVCTEKHVDVETK
jgi:hypothetical protein